ncbi:MFS transporter [Dysgonomonas sp. OttesenSCG-928-M03]|nr:MFS transporter [Dysgonomonas sp. OttesenSCG-928-M03]
MNSWKKTFAIIWSGQLFSTLSSSIVGYAVVFWLSLQTGSAEVLAYAMIATLLPQLVLGLFTGVYIDRWNRKQTMILADSFIAICTAILCIMFYLDKVEIWQVYLLLALRSVGSAFHMPAMQASIPLLAPESELMRISGVNQIIYSISNIAGPAIAAILISFMEMTYVLSLDIVGAAIACISLLFIVIPNPESDIDEDRNFVREIKEGLQAIFHKKGMSWLFICDVMAMFFIIPISALFPLMTLNHFLGNTYQMSLIETIWGVGMLLGGMVIGTNKLKTINKVALIAAMCIVDGLTFLFTGLLPSSGFVFFAIFTGLSGIAAAIWNSAFTVIMQTKIDADKLGRAFSTYDSLMLIPSIPGLLATGYVAETIGLSNAFVMAGIGICVIGFTILMIPSVVQLGKMEKKSN